MELSRILNKDFFLYLLDLEVKRARRYQNFLYLLLLKIKPSSEGERGMSFQDCYLTVSDLLMTEVRESDVLGTLGETQLAALFPYADESAGRHVKSRFEKILEYYDLKNKGWEVIVDQVCFPINGTDTVDLIKMALGTNPS